MTTVLSSCTPILEKPLPNYIAIDFTTQSIPIVLKTPAQPLTFPLTTQDLEDIQILEEKFNQEVNCSGLAAPQIGISKQIIVFAAPDKPDIKKWRPDFTQTMEKSIWINPSWEPLGPEKHEDYEACFSVPDITGPVSRYKRITYQAYTPTGEFLNGTAEGFLARIIQHEIGHLKGELFIDLVPQDKWLKIEEYRQKRAEAIASEEGRAP